LEAGLTLNTVVLALLALKWDTTETHGDHPLPPGGAAEPPGAAEAVEEEAARDRDHAEHHEVAIAPGELGHVLEVHPVEPRDRGRHRQDRGLARQLPADHALPGLLGEQARLEREGQHLAQRLKIGRASVYRPLGGRRGVADGSGA
jgi:hypothetical protein